MIPHLSKHTCTYQCRPHEIPPEGYGAGAKWIGKDGIGWQGEDEHGLLTTRYSETEHKKELARKNPWRGVPLGYRTPEARQERLCLALEMIERWGYRRLRLAYGTHPQLEYVYQQLLRFAQRWVA